ncbi:hypothetical protein EFY79_21085 [Hanamia caeni]|jgi:hypothetical protein|uniref:Uncharacterized protein n=1 Tax=Hanamia caeni TaxID=2294116 RepID=A0A3M9N368_9BACT|nr:hypothetical protein [Hanamia caeni]RNI31747.1 hypothetical protein EFY79_21085 [Hanamia caeni]
MANFMINGFFIFLLVITIVTALIGIFHRQRIQKTKSELITLLITVLTFITLIFYPLLTGHTKGEKWIEAVNKDSTHSISKENLTLRKNGNFTIDLIEADFGSISGTYNKSADTIFLEQASIDKTNSKITSKYLMKLNELVPLFDTINKIKFKITSIN